MMFPRLSVVVCGLVVLAGCAAEEIDGDPPGSGSGNTTSTSGSGGTASGGTPSTTGGRPGTAGTGSGVGNSPSTAGTGSGIAGSGGTPGSAGTSAGGTPSSAGTGTSGSGTGGMPVISLPLTENFEDGVADGFKPWNQDLMAGEWAIVADGATKVYQPVAPVSELEFAVGGKTAWTDVALKVRVKLADPDSGAQIAVRFKDGKTYLFMEMAEGKYKLRGRADGSTQDLVSPSPKPTIVAGTWYTVGITIKGTSASLTLNDTLIGSGTCDALISNGGVALGVAEGSVAFDDLTVTAAP